MKTPNPIDFNYEEKLLDSYQRSTKDLIIRHALLNNDFNSVFESADTREDNQFTFSCEVKTLPVTNQKKSGRCWIFSASNLLREMIAKKAKIQGVFEISQNQIAFYDKLEKCNFVMESVIDLIDKPHDDRKLQFILVNGVGDGGQWDMYVNLVKKYGVCPKASMVETAQSNMTSPSNSLINSSLREFASQAQRIYKETKDLDKIQELKKAYLQKFFSLLADCFGLPPKKFDFEYTDTEGKYHIEKDYTPKSFFDKYVGSEIDEYVSIINGPTEDKPFMHTYNIEYLGNVVGGNKVTHLNLPMERMKELIQKQLENGELVWFGSDVSKYGQRKEGYWDDKSFDFKSAFGLDHKFDKAARLDYYASSMNHAMVLTGFDKKEDKIIRWKVENSWGEENGEKGFFIMSDSFFDAYVYQAAIKKEYLSEDEKAALTSKPILLPPWDPFGTLAD